MNPIPRVLAFASGIGLMFALAYIGGFLAAIPSLPGYFEFFGQTHSTLGLFLFRFVVYSLPVLVLSFIWCWLTLRYVAPSTRAGASWCLGGLAFGWLHYETERFLWLESNNADGRISLVNALIQPYLLPMSWINLLVIPVGLALAVVLSSTAERTGASKASA